VSRRAHRVGARLAAVVALTTAVLLPALPAPAATPSPPTPRSGAPSIAVDTFAPGVARPGDRLQASGRLSAGDEELDDAVVRLRVSTVPVSVRGELTSLVNGVTRREGLAEAAASERVDVEAGDDEVWSLEANLDDLGLTAAGVYPATLDLTDRSSGVPLSTVVTFVSWFPPGDEPQPTSLTWVVPLAGDPVRDADDVHINDSAATEMAQGGRLRTLLEALGGSAVDWAADPELLETASEMSRGYRVVREDGEVVQAGAAGVQAGTDFLAKAVAVLDERTIALPYADVDADALQDAGLDGDLNAAITRGPEVAEALLGNPVRDDVAVPPGGFAQRSTLSTWKAAGARAVVLADAALPPVVVPSYTPTGLATVSTREGPLDAVLADSTLSAVVAAPDASGGTALARQRFLAETLMVTKERPNEPRALVVSPPRDWDVPGEFAAELVGLSGSVPWLTPRSLAELRDLSDESSSSIDRGALTQPEDLPRLSTRQTTGAKELGQSLETFTDILDDDETTTERYRAAILRTESAAWRIDRQTGTALLDAVRTDLDGDIDKVRILSRGTVTLSGTEGRIPVTIENDLDQAVVVEVRITTRTPGRLVIDQPGEVRIEKNRRLSLEISARSLSGGTVPVEVQLFTRSGAPYGEAVDINVRSTAYSRLGLAVVGAALAALVILVIARLTRRARAARRDDTGDAGDDGEDA
jgi:hypothetical protein